MTFVSVSSLSEVRGVLCQDEIAALHSPHCKEKSKSAVMNYSHYYLSALAGANSSLCARIHSPVPSWTQHPKLVN